MLQPTSARERRLWLWAAAVVVAIYSTLGLAGRLAAVLRARNLLDATFAVAFLIVVVAVVGSALRRRSTKHEVWLTLAKRVNELLNSFVDKVHRAR